MAAELNELDDPVDELDALESLVKALFATNSIDEVEPLVLRYREEAKAKSEKVGFCFAEFESILCFSLLAFARSCASAPRVWKPLTTALELLPARPYSV